MKKYFPEGSTVNTNNFMGSVIDPTPDYSKLAIAYGGHGECVINPGQLAPALEQSLEEIEKNRFAVLDIFVHS